MKSPYKKVLKNRRNPSGYAVKTTFKKRTGLQKFIKNINKRLNRGF